MRGFLFRFTCIALLLCLLFISSPQTIVRNSSAAQDYKAQVVRDVDAMAKQTQVMIDTVFQLWRTRLSGV